MLGHWHELEPALQGLRDLGQCGGAGYQQLPTWWTFPVEGEKSKENSDKDILAHIQQNHSRYRAGIAETPMATLLLWRSSPPHCIRSFEKTTI